MAVIGTFGKLSDTVVPIKGDPFVEFWKDDAVPANSPTTVLSTTVSSPKRLLVNGMYVTGSVNCTVELLRDAILVWRGGTSVTGSDLNAVFPDGGEIEFTPGQVLTVTIQHGYRTTLAFAGNVFGFRRT